jgi:hypothetical protein
MCPQHGTGGVLAQAKNGDQVFWEEKFHTANGKAQACTQGAFLFFLLCFGEGGWGGERDFFFLASQFVHSMFPMGSHDFTMMFPNFAMFFPTCVP